MPEVYAVPAEKLEDIANAIRLKRDITTPMSVDDMPLQIGMIASGGLSIHVEKYTIHTTSTSAKVTIPCDMRGYKFGVIEIQSDTNVSTDTNYRLYASQVWLIDPLLFQFPEKGTVTTIQDGKTYTHTIKASDLGAVVGMLLFSASGIFWQQGSARAIVGENLEISHNYGLIANTDYHVSVTWIE